MIKCSRVVAKTRHFRGKPRPGRRVELRFRTEDAGPFAAFTSNIGVGGAFVVTATPPEPGTRVHMTLTLPPTGHALQLEADVRWATRGTALMPAGMGVRFVGLEVDEILKLNEYFATLTGLD